MSKRRLVITAVLAGQSQIEVARTYGVSQGWISRLMNRPGESGDSVPWEGWSHVREYVEEVPGRVA